MRLTSREKEIIEFLKKEPLISQDELAHRFGITRSSVAVHISNLMKKGVILGKGYVFNEQSSIAVIGESSMRIMINNQGEKTDIDVDYGGFAIQISKVFADLGVSVKLLSMVGNDDVGLILLDRLQKNGIDIKNIYRHSKKRSCRKVFLNNKAAFEECFSMQDYEKAIESREWVAFNCEWLVIEPQFQELLYNRALSRNEGKVPYLCTCKHLSDSEEIPEFLAQYSSVVLGIEQPDKMDSYLNAVLSLVENGTQNCILTDGHSRLMYFSKQGVTDFPLLPNQCFNSRNSLPALLAGLIYGLSCGYPLRQAVRIGIGTVAANESKKAKDLKRQAR
jgi:DNA-binding CsgD family transcriptional regulator